MLTLNVRFSRSSNINDLVWKYPDDVDGCFDLLGATSAYLIGLMSFVFNKLGETKFRMSRE